MEVLTTQIVVALLLFVICMVCALIPYKFLTFAQSNTDSSQRSFYETVFSLLNCFAAGVFLATCFLDLLPEVRIVMSDAMELYHIDLHTFPLSEFVAIFGIFLILTIEQTALVFKERFFLRRRSHRHSKLPQAQDKDEKRPLLSPEKGTVQNNYVVGAGGYDSTKINFIPPLSAPTAPISFADETTMSPTSPFSYTPVPIHPSTSLLHKICDRADYSTPCSDTILEYRHPEGEEEGRADEEDDDDIIVITNTTPDDHVVMIPDLVNRDRVTDAGSVTRHEHVIRDHHHHHPVHHLTADEECGHPKFRLYTLVLSLSVHSVFEGSALGLQPSSSAIWALFYALILHKTVVAFSLGLNLVQSHMRPCPDILVCAAIFSSMSPLGVVLSIALRTNNGHVTGSGSPVVTLVSAIMQGVACGTFLYVTFFELLPHEMNSSKNRLLKVAALTLGATLVTTFILYECFYAAPPTLDNPIP